MALLVAVLGLLLSGCADQASSPVAPKVVSDADSDSTVVESVTPAAQCVVVNVTGDNIQVHGADSVTIDTVAVATVTDTVVSQVGFQMVAVAFGGFDDDALTWNSRREGWEYWDEAVSNESVVGVFLFSETRSLFGEPAAIKTWTPFDEFAADEGLDVSYSVNENSVFVNDEDQELNYSEEDDQYRYYYLGVVIVGGE